MQEAHTHQEGKVVQDTDKKIKVEVPEKVRAIAQPLTSSYTCMASEHTTQLCKKLSHMNTWLVQGDKLVRKSQKESKFSLLDLKGAENLD